MTLIPKVPFSDGDIWTPELGYLAFNQVFDDQPSYFGHYSRLADDSLSNANGMIKQRVSAITDPFLVTAGSGLNVNVASGIVTIGAGTTVSLTATTIAVPDNSTSYVYIGSAGVVAVTSRLPAVGMSLAKVVTSAGVITSITDTRALSLRSVRVDPLSSLVFGGQSSTDKVCTAGESLNDGLYYYRDFTVPAGVSITVNGYALIKCSGKVNIAGTITVTPIVAGGTPITAGTAATRYGSGLGSLSTSYPWGLQPYGSGGGAGQVPVMTGTPTAFVSGTGGFGGGGLRIEALDTITISGTINCRGGNAVQGSVTTAGSTVITGSAGGSGGCIILSSRTGVTLSPTSVYNLQGGNGSNGVVASSATPAQGGGGGAGGVMVILCPTANVNTTGATINITGGSSGLASSLITGSGWGSVNGAGFYANGGSANNSATVPVTAPSGALILVNELPLG